MTSDPAGALGAFLAGSEAEALAVRFEAGQRLVQALTAISPLRRNEVERLLRRASLDDAHDAVRTSAVLRAISGAKSVHRDLVPVWTMPGSGAGIGHLTGEFHQAVLAAKQSIVCATYNFERSSRMWGALQEALRQPGVVITVYVDGDKADASAVKAQVPGATVYRSLQVGAHGKVVSHAKFIVLDQEVLLLTSANFSHSAETSNVEFGLRVRDSGLARSVTSTMASKHGVLYGLA